MELMKKQIWIPLKSGYLYDAMYVYMLATYTYHMNST